MDNVFIHLCSLPGKIKGVTVLRNGDHHILINEALSREARDRTLRHEMKHIENNHTYDEFKYITECEKEAAT